jgi:MarR family multiple antibiotic resistance transcriptional regulator
LKFLHLCGVISDRMSGPDTPPERARLVHDIGEALFMLFGRYRQQAAQSFAPLGLNVIRTLVLGLIEREGVRHPGALADALELAPTAVSHILAELEERGLVARSLDPEDRRRVRIELTDEGRRVLGRATEAWNELNAGKLAQLTDAEAVTLRDLLRKVTEAA